MIKWKALAALAAALLSMPVALHADTLADLQLQLADLVTQITALQARIAAVSSIPSAPAVGSISLSRNLALGARGSDVVSLQTFLIGQGLLASDSATGYFGYQTQSAVQGWQSSHGIVSSGDPDSTGFGAVGPRTRAAILGLAAAGKSAAPASAPSPFAATPTASSIPNTSAPASYTWQLGGWSVCSSGLQTRSVSCVNSAGAIADNASCAGAQPAIAQACTPASISCVWNGQTVADGTAVTAYQSASVPAGQACVSQPRTCSNGTLSGSFTAASCVTQSPQTNPGTSASASGTTVPSAASITDASGNVWTLTSGAQIAKNGTVDPITANVNLLLYYNGTVYQEAQTNLWWSWNGSSWVALGANDPRATAAGTASCSFNGQTIASGATVTAYQSSSVTTGQSCISEARICNNGTLSGSYANVSCTVAVSGGTGGTGVPTTSSTGPRVAIGPQASVTCPAGAIAVNPGDNVQSVVNAHPAGTTYCFAAGTFAKASVSPRNGDTYIGHVGTVFDGQNATARAFASGAQNVTIKNFVIKNYTPGAQQGAIDNRNVGGGSGANWIVMNNELAYNNAVGIEFQNGTQVVANYMHHNVQEGYACGGSNDVLTDNEIAFNNPNNATNAGWEAGGGKCWATKNLSVKYNYSHDNKGPGLWTDNDNEGTHYEYNRVENNQTGIMHEISWDAVIANNYTNNNQAGASCGWIWCTGILIAGSGGPNGKIIDIYNNKVIGGNGHGISLIQQNRGSGLYGTYHVNNVHVHNNSIDLAGNRGVGAVTDNGYTAMFSSAGNYFDYDTYTGGSGNFNWNGGTGNFSWFQSQGQEAHGQSQ